MRLFAIFVLLALASIFSPGPGHLEAADMKTLLNGAMESLGEVKGSPGLCVLTDANYVNLNGKSAVGYVDLIQEVTGCSVGRGNLLFFQRKQSHPLIIALLKKDTRDCVVIRHDGREAGSVKVNIHPDSVAAPGAWERMSESLGSDAFALVNIGDAWAGGAPYDFLKCAELHNHICPGLCSGYFIAKFIQEKYPLAEGESYSFIACPNWCKDDAVQVLLDLTAGKKNLAVKGLTEEQKQELVSPDAAGILVLRQGRDRPVKAVILGFDWQGSAKLSGADKYEGLRGKMQMLLGLIPYFDKPGEFVRVLKEVSVSAEIADALFTAGVNPYAELGFVKK